MNRLTAKSRIVIGLVCLLVSILLAAMVLGILPDAGQAEMRGRAKLCEAIAINSSVFVTQNDIRRLEVLLGAIVRRNEDVLSAAVRRIDGRLVVDIGNHDASWQAMSSERSIDTQVQVPIRADGKKWGTVEVRFVPVRPHGLMGIVRSPWTRFIVFVASASFLVYFVYLKKMLNQLDPSKAVPERVRSALDTLAEGLLVLDRNERIVLANQAFARTFGRYPDQLIGQRASQLSWIANAVADGLKSDETNKQSGECQRLPWLGVMENSAPQFGSVLRLRDGHSKLRTFMVNASPVLAQTGKSCGVLVSFEDVTELEEKKVELGKSKEAAEAASAAKSEFLARMSHEIRTPMNAILGFTDVLRRGFARNESERDDYLDTIHSSGTHLLDLINDILDLAKVESGRMEIEPRRCSPYQLITQVMSVLEIRAKEKGISLEYDSRGSLPETILTDPVRFRQILTNLLGNAIKFTDRGCVKVFAELLVARKMPLLAVHVADTGIGMSPETLDRIFDPFVQADSSITRRFGGTGLGLSISRRFAQALGGDLGVRSRLGKGSVFTATVQTGSLDGVRMLDTHQQVSARRLEAPKKKSPSSFRHARVLVADDGPDNRKLITLVLERAGLQVTAVENGLMACEAASKQSFNVVLMDMQMPVMDGYTAATNLRQNGYDGPIIALTAHAMKGDEQKCRAAGCSGFLTKPIDMDRLIQTLSKALGSERPAASPRSSDYDSLRPFSGDAVPSSPATVADNTADEIADQWTSGRPAIPRKTAKNRLTSSLPTEDPEFHQIVVDFVQRLREKLDAMRHAWDERNFDELAFLAHWLKGSGGTAGFDAFTEPASQLEESAKNQQTDRIPPALAALDELIGRIEVSSPEMVESSR